MIEILNLDIRDNKTNEIIYTIELTTTERKEEVEHELDKKTTRRFENCCSQI